MEVEFHFDFQAAPHTITARAWTLSHASFGLYDMMEDAGKVKYFK